MSNPSASHVRPSFAGRTWRGFGRWRRSRPFWGGLLLLLSGTEIFLSTQLSLGGLSFQLGPTGFLSWVIPTILVACGVLAWATPQQRMFYAIVGAVTAVFSLIGVNLGGFFLGLILGIIGAGLVFGWTPVVAATPAAIPTQPGPEDREVDETAEQPVSGNLVPGFSETDGPERPSEADGSLASGPAHSADVTAPPAHEPVPTAESSADGSMGPGGQAGAASDGPERSADVPGSSAGVPAQAGDADGTSSDVPPTDPAALPRRESPRFYTVIGFLLVLGLTGVMGLRLSTPAYAAPCPKPPATASKPGGDDKPQVPAAPPAATPTPTPTTSGSEEDKQGLLGSIVNGITGLFDGDSGKEEGATEPTPAPTPPVKPSPSKTTTAPTKPKPNAGDCSRGAAASAEDHADQPTLPMLGDQGLPDVNSHPSLLTGSKLTMWDLNIAGIATLHSAAGDIKVLKFTMSRSRVDDFALRVPQGEGRPLLIKSDPLVVKGNVAFYATRFVGRIPVLGVKLTLTPESPIPPDGIPLTVPKIEFTDPQIQLAYVACDTLQAPTLDESLPPAST
ncbi:DUF6114 domain-containing protein [Asanoa sp. NPDC049573]|uniref:DUF6114 domain-containing protein n=1 Tax=Asanoa sp. NPDC049573 TaxID=3155396 RepID=UPI0034212A28